jgi:hypothetical protein
MFLFFCWLEGVTPPPTPLGNPARAWIQSLDDSERGKSLRARATVAKAEYSRDGAAGALPQELLRLSLRLGEPPQLDLLDPVTEEERMKAQERRDSAASGEYWRMMRDWHAERYLPLFQSFYADAQVEDFLSSHADEYLRVVDSAARTLSEVELPALVSDYLRTPALPLVVVVSVLIGDWYGWEYTMTDGDGRPVAVVCVGVSGRLASGGPLDDAVKLNLLGLIGHEYIHPLIGPHGSVSADDPAKYAQLYEAAARVLSAAERQAYPAWDGYWQETVVRALDSRVTLRVLKRLRPEYSAEDLEQLHDRMVAGDVSRGWFYLPAAAAKLKEYEVSSDDFATFCPRLLESLPSVQN